MSRLCKVITSVVVTCSMLATTSLTVFADGTQTIMYDSTIVKQVPVELEKSETFEVTLPRSLKLDGSGESSETQYSISVNGNIGSTNFVRVIPESTLVLTNEDGSATLTADVTQNKTRWNSSELSVSNQNNTIGTITISNVEPGKWSGYLNYRVSLDDTGVWSQATCTEPAKCLGYDTNDNGILDDNEKLDVPITKGTAIGHNFDLNSSSFPSICSTCLQEVYALSSVEQFYSFINMVNSGEAFDGKTIELCTDLDINNQIIESIGSDESTPFCGNFNGNGRTISNLRISGTVQSSYDSNTFGLFGYCSGTNQTITDLTLQNIAIQVSNSIIDTTSTITSYVGGLVGKYNYRGQSLISLTNCHVYDLSVTTYDNDTVYPNYKVYIGGLVGLAETSWGASCTLSNCSATGDVAVYADCIVSMAGLANCVATVLKNSYAAVSFQTLADIFNFYPCISGVASDATICNNFYVRDVMSGINIGINSEYGVIANEITKDDVENTSVGVDILNTDNTEYVWERDLTLIHSGFPYIK